MKKNFFIIILLGFCLLARAQTTAVLHYLPTLSAEQAEAYRGYDMIVVDHEVINNSPENLRLMREENPNLKILVYANKIEWHNPMFLDKPWSLKMVAELKKYPKWFLKGTNRKKLVFWPGTVLMNCRLDCPRYIINGKSYNYIEYFTEHYINDIIGAYQKEGIRLDGLLDDELLKSISFIGSYGQNHGVDSNSDGKNDNKAELNRQWRLGNAYFLKTIRQTMGPDFLIIGNGGHGYYLDWCDGKMFEYFPEIYLNEADTKTEAWPENMRHAAGIKVALFNARADNYGHPDNWLFTICSAMLLSNVIFSHGQNMPYREDYCLNLGKPLGSCEIDTVNGDYFRQFQNGTVYVNPVSKKGWIAK